MSRFRKLFEMSFRAKVLVPVIGIMICLMAVTAWIVDQRITRQFEADARQSLTTADEAFRASQELRHKNMLLRFRDLPGQPLYNAVFQKAVQAHDTLTLREPLDRLLAQPGVDVVLFSSADQRVIASAERDPLVSTVELGDACGRVITQALAGQERSD